VTYYPLYTAAGVEIQIPAAAMALASAWIPLDPADFAGVPHLKLRSGANGSGANQGADRTITLIARSI
jgi:hypothetical protein